MHFLQLASKSVQDAFPLHEEVEVLSMSLSDYSTHGGSDLMKVAYIQEDMRSVGRLIDC